MSPAHRAPAGPARPQRLLQAPRAPEGALHGRGGGLALVGRGQPVDERLTLLGAGAFDLPAELLAGGADHGAGAVRQDVEGSLQLLDRHALTRAGRVRSPVHHDRPDHRARCAAAGAKASAVPPSPPWRSGRRDLRIYGRQSARESDLTSVSPTWMHGVWRGLLSADWVIDVEEAAMDVGERGALPYGTIPSMPPRCAVQFRATSYLRLSCDGAVHLSARLHGEKIGVAGMLNLVAERLTLPL